MTATSPSALLLLNPTAVSVCCGSMACCCRRVSVDHTDTSSSVRVTVLVMVLLTELICNSLVGT